MGVAARPRPRPTPSGCWPRSPSTGPARARSSARCRRPGRTPAAPARCSSPEIWESSTSPTTRLPQQRTMARRYGPHSLFRFVRERSAMVFGLADATMSRDEGWLFLVLGPLAGAGRHDLAAALHPRAAPADAAPSWTLVLRSTGAYEPYLRTYRGIGRTPAGPRSSCCWTGCSRARCSPRWSRPRRAWPSWSGRPSATRPGSASPARRTASSAGPAPMLEFMSTAELLAELPPRLEELQRTCSAASAAVTAPLLHRAGAAGVGAGGGRVSAQSQTPVADPGRRGRGRPAHRWRLQVVHRTRFHYAGPVALLLQRGADDPGEQQPADDAALPGRDRAGRHRATPTATTGAPRSPRSTCTARTRSWWSPATSIVEAGPRPRAGTTGSAGAAWPRREVRDQFGELLPPDPAAPRMDDERGGRRPARPSATPHPHEAGPAGLPVRPRAHGVPVRLDRREDQRDAGVDPGQGRLPGHLARHRRPAARAGPAGPVRLRLPAPQARTPAIGEPVTGREPRLGGVVGRRLERLRPDQLRRDRQPARHARPGPRLRRRPAVQGPVLRARRARGTRSRSRSPASPRPEPADAAGPPAGARTSLRSHALTADRRGVRHGVDVRAGEPGDRGGQRLGQHPGRLHPRPLAAAEQLGQLGGVLRAGRLRAADAGLAGRSGDGRRGPGEPGGPRQEDPEADRRSHHRDHPGAGQEASGHGALDRGPAGADARGPGPRGGHGGDRPRGLPWRPAAAALGAQGGGPVPGQPAARAAARSRSRSTSSSTAGRTRWTRRRRRSSTTRSTSPAPGSLSCRWATRTSTRGRRRRSTRRTPTAVPC